MSDRAKGMRVIGRARNKRIRNQKVREFMNTKMMMCVLALAALPLGKNAGHGTRAECQPPRVVGRSGDCPRRCSDLDWRGGGGWHHSGAAIGSARHVTGVGIRCHRSRHEGLECDGGGSVVGRRNGGAGPGQGVARHRRLRKTTHAAARHQAEARRWA